MTVSQIYENFTGPQERETPVRGRLPEPAVEDFTTFPAEGRSRVVIENVTPSIDGGRHPIKRVVGDQVVVEADLYADGPVALSAVVKYRAEDEAEWSESPMVRLANDRWRGEFTVTKTGPFLFTIEAWVDRFKSWRYDVRKKIAAGQNVAIDLTVGAKLIEEASRRAPAPASERLKQWASALAPRETAAGWAPTELALDESLGTLALRHTERKFVASGRHLRVTVDPERARFGAWYEMFPRSCSPQAGRHGTFKDCEAQLPRIVRMGFNVLCFPPVHPIGRLFRKGKNNSPVSQPTDPGNPWAIGGAEGGHKAVHPELGTLDDLRRLVNTARALGVEVALDIALQCSPDHPYLRDHPEWFCKRPDGSIAYAENPPKKFQDIYPFDFECENWRGLWAELKSIFEFWISHGVRIFRVNNPHTKSLAFWEWCLAALKKKQPDLVFLADAFARSSVMYGLAKAGFSQSNNYFPWRNSKQELTEYFTELTQPSAAEFFRPNLWPNTHDILPEQLQAGGRASFEMRLILAATLSASYGIYGPAFELGENKPLKPGSEEYHNSEKYEIRRWNFETPGNLADLIARINRVRQENPTLQSNRHLRFHQIDNDHLIAYSKSTGDASEVVLVVVNLDASHVQSGWLELTDDGFIIEPAKSYQVQDLLTGTRSIWHGRRNFIELNPQHSAAHIFRLQRRLRTERDFDQFM